MGLKDFDIITGVDGDYVVKGGALVLVTKVSKSGNWNDKKPVGKIWQEFELSDGQKLKIETSIAMEYKDYKKL